MLIALPAAASTCLLAPPLFASAALAAPERVSFPSRDGRTALIGYVFQPVGPRGRLPAVVMLHGRGGAYSSTANGVYEETTLSARHRLWGERLAAEGFLAILVDDFGPLGYPGGFPSGSYKQRPPQFDEVHVRPLHAYGALDYLRTRDDVDEERIGLMGWSNGASAALVAVAQEGGAEREQIGRFKAAVAMYPGCGLRGHFERVGYRPYAPVRVHSGTNDQEVSPDLCWRFVERSRGAGSDVALSLHAGATHGFDTPTARVQSLGTNARATNIAVGEVLSFFTSSLKPTIFQQKLDKGIVLARTELPRKAASSFSGMNTRGH